MLLTLKIRSGPEPRLRNIIWPRLLHLDVRLQHIAIFLVTIIRIAIDT